MALIFKNRFLGHKNHLLAGLAVREFSVIIVLYGIEYLNIGEELWNWNYIFEPVAFYIGDMDNHKLKYLEPKVDFFKTRRAGISCCLVWMYCRNIEDRDLAENWYTII